MSAMHELIAGLSEIDWTSRPHAHRAAQSLLAQITDPAALLEDTRGRDPRLTESDRSAEKTTHFKWFVDRDAGGRFELWLNEYKPSTHRRTGHAEVPHNHRFWFTSLLLNGGFSNTIYEPDPDDDARLRELRTITYGAGDTFVADPAEVHSLRDLEEGTVTLLVQSQPISSYSSVYENGRVIRYHDLPSARSSFNSRLAALPPFDGERHHY